jgi:3'(2'), 5'-bisphosphate nucleotidase
MVQIPRDRQALLQEVCQLAAQAGAKAMAFYSGEIAVTLKSDSSPLTAADRASHELIVPQLARLTPGIAIISEESEAAPTIASEPDAPFWLVDPLDGTKEFLKRTGEFTVNIGLIERRQPVLGVVHAPALNRTYSADLAVGAFRKDQGKAAIEIRVQRAQLDKLRVVASKDHAGPLVQAMLSRLPNAELKSMGSSLKFCLVAEGEADVYLRDVPTMEWDTAAAQCVVEAAGGKLWTLDGQPLRYGKPGPKNPAVMAVGDSSVPWMSFLQNEPG